jgi:hypothetical protein
MVPRDVLAVFRTAAMPGAGVAEPEVAPVPAEDEPDDDEVPCWYAPPLGEGPHPVSAASPMAPARTTSPMLFFMIDS